MPKTKKQLNGDELMAAEQTLITPVDATQKELKGTALEQFAYQPQGAIPRVNPAIRGTWQNVGNSMSIKHN
jgi:hypothetical protein